MKRIIHLTLLIVSICLIGCASDEDQGNAQLNILKVDINGEPFDFSSTPTNVSRSSASFTNGKKLFINGRENTSLTLTIGDIFLENPIQEGTYKIGTVQDNLETNIAYFDPMDSDTNTGGSIERYLGAYGCNVLSNDLVGTINITELDTANKIVSGTFSGSLFRWIDVTTGESKSIELTNGVFTLTYNEINEELNPSRNLISARVNGYRFMSEDPGSPNSVRSASSGVDKITLNGYDSNFGRIKISVPSDVIAGNVYSYSPDGSFQSLGVRFENRINIPEIFTFNNPNQSNDSYISIINHDPEANTIEGNFYIENSEIEGRTIADGYFNISYIDAVD